MINNKNNYYGHQGYYLSSKDSSSKSKLRLWRGKTTDNLVLVSTKIYDYETNTIERSHGNKKSSIPMMNQVTKGKTLDFFVSEGDFYLSGKQKDGKLVALKTIKNFPQTEKKITELGSLAQRYCHKILSELGSNIPELSKICKLK